MRKFRFFTLAQHLLGWQVLGNAFSICQAFAQTTTVQGIVTDAQTGERLPYATVILKGAGVGAKTNIEGIFVLSNVPAELWTLEVRYIGYAPENISVDARKPIENLNIKLKQQPISGEEVTIVAEPEPRTFKSEKEPSLVAVSPKELIALPNIGEVDIFRSLQLLPGVSGTNDASSGLYVRGGAPDQNLILFDGMIVHHVDHFFGFFSAFNVDAVKDVQFYKGGFPAKYGGVLSSVVDMTGKAGDQNDLCGAIGANLLSAHGNIEVPLWGKGSLFVAGRTTYGESKLAQSIYEYLTGQSTSQGPGGSGGPGGGGFPGFMNANFSEEIPLPSFYDLNTKATYYLTPTDVVSSSFYASNDGLDKSQELPNGGGTTDKTKQGNLGFSGKWFHQWGSSLFTNLVIVNSRYTSKYVLGTQFSDTSVQRSNQRGLGTDEENVINDFSARLDNEWHPHQDHAVGFGLQLSSVHSTYSLRLSDPFRDTTSNLLDIDQRGVQVALYAQNKWALSPVFDIIFGGRATYYQPTKQFFVNPRVSLHFAITENLSFKGAIGTYRQFLNRIVNESITQGSRDFWLLTDNDFKPGKSDHYIIGTTWEIDNFLFDVEAYYKTMSGLVEFSQRFRRFATDQYAFAAGTGISRGLEVLLQKKHGSYTGWASYTLSKTMYAFPDNDHGDEFPAAQDQRHEVKLVNTLTLGKWTFSASWMYGSGKPYTAPVSQYYIEELGGTTLSYVHVGEKNAMRLPAYHRLDASVSYIFKSDNYGTSLSAGLSVFNLYNRKNISYYTYDLSTSPPTITAVSSLGITPTLFLQLDFK